MNDIFFSCDNKLYENTRICNNKKKTHLEAAG